MSETIAGLPAAAASSATIPNDSGSSEGATLNSERRSASITNGCGSGSRAMTPGTSATPSISWRPIRTSGGAPSRPA